MRLRSSTIVLTCTCLSLVLLVGAIASTYKDVEEYSLPKLWPWWLALLASCAPYILILSLFRTGAERKADGLAVGVALYGLVAILVLPNMLRTGISVAASGVAYMFGVMINFLLSLIVAAAGGFALSRLERKSRALPMATAGFVAAICLSFAAFAVMPRRPMIVYETTAVGSVRTLNTALVTYYSMYNEFPEKLSQLGGIAGTREASGLIDETLASGEKNGYRFIYRRGEKDKQGNPTYSVVAIGLDPTRSQRNFYSDQSGVIRFTPEFRAPTVNDRPLQ